MKKFIFTRFGMNNFTRKWFTYRTSVVKYFTLQGMENNAGKDLYWIIFVNRDIPIEEKLRINKMIDSSSIRGNIYLIDIDYMFEMRELSLKFVKEHAEADEQVILAHCDADDVYRKGFLDKIEAEVKNYDIGDKTSVFTFPYGYRFLLYEKVMAPWVEECRSMNNFIVTSDREVCIFQSPHHLYKEYCKKHDWNFYSNDVLQYFWFKTESADNVDNIYNPKKYDICYKKVMNNANVITLEQVALEFGLDYGVINKFYDEFPEIIDSNEALVYRNPLVDVAKKAYLRQREIKKIFIKYVMEQEYSFEYRKQIKTIQKKCKTNALRAIGLFFDLDLAVSKELSSINDFEQYIVHIEERKDNLVIAMVVAGEKKNYGEQAKLKELLGLREFYISENGYTAIVDSENNYFFEQKNENITCSHEFYANDELFKIAVKSSKKNASILVYQNREILKNIEKDDREYCLNNNGLNVLVFDKTLKKVIDLFSVDVSLDGRCTLNRKMV